MAAKRPSTKSARARKPPPLVRSPRGSLDEALDKAKRFDPGRINPQVLAATGGAPDEE